jgi:hypothetical protein
MKPIIIIIIVKHVVVKRRLHTTTHYHTTHHSTSCTIHKAVRGWRQCLPSNLSLLLLTWSSVNMTFSVLMSRCITPFSCRYATALRAGEEKDGGRKKGDGWEEETRLHT